MTRQLAELAHPPVAGLSEQQRVSLADECRCVATALRERAALLYDACDGRAALAITELTDLADLVQARATTYEEAMT